MLLLRGAIPPLAAAWLMGQIYFIYYSDNVSKFGALYTFNIMALTFYPYCRNM
jgi:hypothetical protein